MKIDWKEVAKSEGYKSLKAKYIADVQEANNYRQKFNRKPMRDKAEFYRHFRKIIARAINHAYHLNKPVGEILTEWESTKGHHWWMNYNLPPALGSNHPCVQPKNERKIINESIRRTTYPKALARLRKIKSTLLKTERKKRRWSKEYKQLQREYGRGWFRK